MNNEYNDRDLYHRDSKNNVNCDVILHFELIFNICFAVHVNHSIGLSPSVCMYMCVFLHWELNEPWALCDLYPQP